MIKDLVVIVYTLVLSPHNNDVRSFVYHMPKSVDVCAEQMHAIPQALPHFMFDDDGWKHFAIMPIGFCTTEDKREVHAEWYKQFVAVALDNVINPPQDGAVIEGLPRYPQQQRGE